MALDIGLHASEKIIEVLDQNGKSIDLSQPVDIHHLGEKIVIKYAGEQEPSSILALGNSPDSTKATLHLHDQRVLFIKHELSLPPNSTSTLAYMLIQRPLAGYANPTDGFLELNPQSLLSPFADQYPESFMNWKW